MKPKKVFIAAAELLFKRPEVQYSCNAIEEVIEDYDSRIYGETFPELLYYQKMFAIDRTFDDIFFRLMGQFADHSQLFEIRLLALCLAQSAFDSGAEF